MNLTLDFKTTWSKNLKILFYNPLQLNTHKYFVFNLCEEKISRTDYGQPRPKYIFNKCGTNIYFFTEVLNILLVVLNLVFFLRTKGYNLKDKLYFTELKDII